jgi:type II secretory pathway pseudopilin PulG
MSTKLIVKLSVRRQGFALVDAMVGLAIAGILCTVFLASVYNATVSSAAAYDQFQANLAVLEMYEIVVALSKTNSGFLMVSNSGCTDVSPCYFVRTGSSWAIIDGQETLPGQGLSRSFSVSEVRRGSSFATQIQANGGTIDPDTISISFMVSSQRRGVVKTQNATTYLHNLKLNS